MQLLKWVLSRRFLMQWIFLMQVVIALFVSQQVFTAVSQWQIVVASSTQQVFNAVQIVTVRF